MMEPSLHHRQDDEVHESRSQENPEGDSEDMGLYHLSLSSFRNLSCSSSNSIDSPVAGKKTRPAIMTMSPGSTFWGETTGESSLRSR